MLSLLDTTSIVEKQKHNFNNCCLASNNQPQMLEKLQQRVTERTEETEKAPCKLVLLDPHPVFRMPFGACIHLCELKRKEKKKVPIKLRLILGRIKPSVLAKYCICSCFRRHVFDLLTHQQRRLHL